MRWNPKRRLIRWFAGGLVVLACVVTWVMWAFSPMSPGGTVSASQIATLHALCVQDMVANTCKVTENSAAQVTAQPGDLVFVAGVGPIDALAYHQMYAAGDAMCSVVRDACVKEWNGAQCMTARALYQP